MGCRDYQKLSGDAAINSVDPIRNDSAWSVKGWSFVTFVTPNILWLRGVNNGHRGALDT